MTLCLAQNLAAVRASSSGDERRERGTAREERSSIITPLAASTRSYVGIHARALSHHVEKMMMHMRSSSANSLDLLLLFAAYAKRWLARSPY